MINLILRHENWGTGKEHIPVFDLINAPKLSAVTNWLPPAIRNQCFVKLCQAIKYVVGLLSAVTDWLPLAISYCYTLLGVVLATKYATGPLVEIINKH